MKLNEYMQLLPNKRKLSDVKIKILTCLWGKDECTFPKPWVSSAELFKITGQNNFDRRTRELRDQLGCNIETEYQQKFSGYGYRLGLMQLALPIDREYLSKSQKEQLFRNNNYCCSTCGVKVEPGVKGLQADHKVPLSRRGGNEIKNWQPMCNNCNVAKRRACQGCDLDCYTCSWAFPERTLSNFHSLIKETEV